MVVTTGVQSNTAIYIQGCHGQGKTHFLQGQKKVQEFCFIREILNSTLKSVKSQGVLFLAHHQVWERVS